MNTEHIHNRISQRAFHLFLMDLKELRGKYRIINEEIPHGVVMNAKKDMIIDRLLVEEFGVEAVDEYRAQVAEWEQIRAEVEGKAFDDDSRFLPEKKPTVEEILLEDLPHLKARPSQKKQLSRKHGC